jgi:hypothetical protein
VSVCSMCVCVQPCSVSAWVNRALCFVGRTALLHFLAQEIQRAVDQPSVRFSKHLGASYSAHGSISAIAKEFKIARSDVRAYAYATALAWTQKTLSWMVRVKQAAMDGQFNLDFFGDSLKWDCASQAPQCSVLVVHLELLCEVRRCLQFVRCPS